MERGGELVHEETAATVGCQQRNSLFCNLENIKMNMSIWGLLQDRVGRGMGASYDSSIVQKEERQVFTSRKKRGWHLNRRFHASYRHNQESFLHSDHNTTSGTQHRRQSRLEVACALQGKCQNRTSCKKAIDYLDPATAVLFRQRKIRNGIYNFLDCFPWVGIFRGSFCMFAALLKFLREGKVSESENHGQELEVNGYLLMLLEMRDTKSPKTLE